MNSIHGVGVWLASGAIALAIVLAAGSPPGEVTAPYAGQVPPRQEVALRQVLQEGCDSDAFVGEVERFLIADAQARQRGVEPGTADYDEILDGAGVVRFDRMMLAAYSLHQNEHHDCQRLLVGDSGGWTYGPLVGIYVRPLLLTGPTPSGGEVRAEMWNFSETGYSSLGITGPGRFCIWMEGAGTTWEPSVVFQPTAADSCEGLDPTNEEDSLVVTAQLSTTAQEIVGPPPVGGLVRTARWMWDDRNEVQFIGLRCDSLSWCSLRPDDVQPGQPAVPAANVPGASDTQYLGIIEDGELVPSGLLGTIEPLGGVLAATPDDQRSKLIGAGPGGMPSARITLDGNDPAARAFYAEKLDIDTNPGQPQKSVDVIIIRVTPDGADRQNPAADLWEGWAQSKGPGSAHPLTVAADIPHSGLGTVRWRWFENDERGWLPCRNGCCTYY